MKLGGYQPIVCRSVDDALRLPASDERPTAAVIDLGLDSGTLDVRTMRVLLVGHDLLQDEQPNVVVILPESLSHSREALRLEGATVLVRPYPPSELYAAIRSADASTADSRE